MMDSDDSDVELDASELMLAREKPGATKDALWTETMRGEGLPAEEGGEGEYRHSGPVAALREQLVRAEKDAEPVPRERLAELSVAPPSPPSTSDPTAATTTSSISSAGREYTFALVSALLQAVAIAIVLVALSVSAVYADTHGLWPETPTLPDLPGSLPELRKAFEKAAAGCRETVRGAAHDWGVGVAAAATHIQAMGMDGVWESGRVTVRRVSAAVSSYRHVETH